MTQANAQPTCCVAAPKLVFSCSGAADVGEISDRAARKLSAEGAGKMFCLAGVGGRASGITASTETAAAILAIDGCPLDCARKTLEEAGFIDLCIVNGPGRPTEGRENRAPDGRPRFIRCAGPNKQFAHVRLNDLGMEKGKSPATEERIAQVVSHGKSRLAGLGKP